MSAILSIRNLTVRFGGLCALNDFSMDVAKGAIHALIGPNGAGKSTVFNCISRFCDPAEGSIEFEGSSVLKRPSHDVIRIGIGRTFQNLELLAGMTVLENVLVGLSRRIPNYLPFGPSPRRSRTEAQAVRDAEDILDQTGLAALSRPSGRRARFRPAEAARPGAGARGRRRSFCCSTSQPQACEIAKFPSSIRCCSTSCASAA